MFQFSSVQSRAEQDTDGNGRMARLPLLGGAPPVDLLRLDARRNCRRKHPDALADDAVWWRHVANHVGDARFQVVEGGNDAGFASNHVKLKGGQKSVCVCVFVKWIDSQFFSLWSKARGMTQLILET